MKENLLCRQIETGNENFPERSTERAERFGGSAFFRDAQQSLKILRRNWKRVKKPRRKAVSTKLSRRARKLSSRLKESARGFG